MAGSPFQLSTEPPSFLDSLAATFSVETRAFVGLVVGRVVFTVAEVTGESLDPPGTKMHSGSRDPGGQRETGYWESLTGGRSRHSGLSDP